MRLALISSVRHASIRKRLWLGTGAVAVFIGTLLVSLIMSPTDPRDRGKVGLDFIAFYTAGRFVREGRSRDLYNIHDVQVFQRELARQNGVELGTAVGPWWNPPFYAWVFVPIARLNYTTAIKCWIGINLACELIACGILCLWIVRAGGKSPATWLLVPALLLLSTPFIQSLSHGQNTGTSLLIITVAVIFWRSDRALLAGMMTGLMFYKPQLAAVLSAVLVLNLGWLAAAGIAITGAALLMASLALPGSIGDFIQLMPKNLHFVQCDVVYLWDRHVTFKAFWRLLLQGFPAGEPTALVTTLSFVCSTVIGLALARAIWAGRTLAGAAKAIYRDRLIAATIAATPLLMPFYFDYDQLLLAIPAVLFALEMIERRNNAPTPVLTFTEVPDRSPQDPALRSTSEPPSLDRNVPTQVLAHNFDRWLLRIWPIQYVWMMFNPDIASISRVNIGVLLLTGVCGALIARAARVKPAEQCMNGDRTWISPPKIAA